MHALPHADPSEGEAVSDDAADFADAMRQLHEAARRAQVACRELAETTRRLSDERDEPKQD